jgi:hypothetical protein
MSLTSPSLARADLLTLLSPITGARVVDHDPFIVEQQATVTIFYAGQDELVWRFVIRIYVPNEPGAREGQVLLDGLIPQFDTLLDSQWGPLEWTVEYDFDLRRLIASLAVTAGRED